MTSSTSGIDPQLIQDMEQMSELQDEVQKTRQKILELSAALKNMANPMYGIQVLMNLLMGEQGSQVAGLSAADNMDSDLRSDITGMQTIWNKMSSPGQNADGSPKKVDPNDAADFLNQIQALVSFLRSQLGMGDNAQVDASTAKTMLDAISSMPLADSSGNWQSPSDLAAAIDKWNAEPKGSGTADPAVQQMQNGLQTCNQSVSSISTSTNTQLQFQAEQYKQFLGIDQDLNQSQVQLLKQFVANEKGGM